MTLIQGLKHSSAQIMIDEMQPYAKSRFLLSEGIQAHIQDNKVFLLEELGKDKDYKVVLLTEIISF